MIRKIVVDRTFTTTINCFVGDIDRLGYRNIEQDFLYRKVR